MINKQAVAIGILAALGIGVYLATRKRLWAALWGTVTDTSGNPIQGAFVSTVGMAEGHFVVTDASGHYGFFGWRPTGEYTLICTKEGYVDVVMPITLEEGANEVSFSMIQAST